MTPKEKAIALSRIATALAELEAVVAGLHAAAPATPAHVEACRVVAEVGGLREMVRRLP